MERDELKELMGYPPQTSITLESLRDRSVANNLSVLDIARADVAHLEHVLINAFFDDWVGPKIRPLVTHVEEVLGQQEVNEVTGSPVDEEAIAEALYYFRHEVEKINER